MEISQLEYFISVERFLNFSKAAEDRHVVQATISKQIARLESELGVQLFERSSHDVRITEAGKTLALYAPVFIEYHNSIISRVQNAPHGIVHTLRIGIGPMEASLLRGPLKIFHEKFPNTQIELSTYTYPVLLTRYRNNVLDLAICNELCAMEMDSFILEPIYSSPWQVVATQEHPFWTLLSEEQKVLYKQTIITQLQNPYDPVHLFCERNATRQHILLPTNFLDTQFEMIQANLGIALLPPFVKSSLPERTRMEDLLDPPLTSTFYAAYNPVTISPELQELIRLCKQCNQQ